MKFKKLLSYFLSIAMLVSTFTALPFTVSAETFDDTVVQTVFELNAEDIISGNVPTYVNVNTSVLDTANTSSANGVLSTVVQAETDFIQIDLEAAGQALPGTDLDQYTIEFVTNAVDSDDTTKNGTILYANGTANKLLLRNREGSDVTTNQNGWGGDQYKGVTTITKAYYTITDLKLADGTAASHKATYDTATATGTNLFSGVANGQALTAWAKAPIKGLTIKAAAGYRANIAKLKITRKASFTSTDFVKDTKTVYKMNVDDILAGKSTSGVVVSNLDKTNSSAANGLISGETTASTDFMTITFDDLPTVPNVDSNDELTPIYDVNMEFAFVDSDDTTKNGAWIFFDEVKDPSNMLLRIRETRDGTVYKDGSGTVNNGTLGTQKIPTAYYNFKINTDTGLFNQHFLNSGKEYVFGNTLTHGDDINLGQSVEKIILKTPHYSGESYRVVLKSLEIKRTAYIENVQYTIGATSENDTYGTVAVTGVTEGKAQKGNDVTLTATANDGYVFTGWYKQGAEEASSTSKSWTFAATENVSYVAKFAVAQEVTQTVYEMNVNDILDGASTSGVVVSNIDKTNSSATNGLISGETTASTDFMTITFDDLPTVSSTGSTVELTPIYDVNMEFAFVDSDDTTKNGAWIFFDEVKDPSNMLLRIRETRDGTVYKDGSGTVNNGSLGTQKIPTAYYNFKINTDTGLFNQHFLNSGKEYVFGNTLTHGDDINLGQSVEKIIIKTPHYSGESYRVVLKSLKITRKALIPSATCTINATTENAERGAIAIEGVSTDEATLGQVQSGQEVTLTATRNPGYLFKGWYKEGSDVPVSTDSVYTFTVTESASYIARFVESYVANKVVFELDAEALKAGNIPAGVTLDSEIFNEDATSATAGLISDVVAANTDFLTINLSEVGIGAGEEGKDIYTIELVTNLNDSDSETKNGTMMYFNGAKMAFRARESSDFCVMSDSWADPAWNATTASEAHYTISNLNATTGAATSHLAQRMTASGLVNQYSSTAIGGELSEWSSAPVTTLTFKVPNGYRANLKSLKITRQVEIPREYVNVEAVTENDAYGIVTDIGDTAIKYSEITLTAEAKEGYIFAGWYDGNTLVSDEETWTFQVLESFSYTAKFRKVVEEWVEVYGMDIADILAGETVSGVTVSNLDTTNSSSANGLMSAESDASKDFMTITFASLPRPEIAENDILTDVFRVDMKLNLVDNDDTTKNGALVYYNEVATANMLARARETRDGTFYKNGSATIYGGNVGSQQIPSFAYNFKMDTKTGLFNQYVKHGVGDYYLFTDTASRGDDITLPASPNKIIIRNADYNSNGVNENYRVNIKSLSVKRLVKVVDTGNAVPVFSKDRVTVVAENGEVWSGQGAFTTDVEKIVIDFGSEIDASQITNDTVFITCDDAKIESTASATTDVDGITLVTITGMTFEDGKTYKIIADGIKNTRGASLQKLNEYVAITMKSDYEGIFIKSTSVDNVADIAPNTNITVNVEYSNVGTEKDVYVLYVAYKGDTKADVKLAKLENVSGSGSESATITTGNVSDIENVEFIIWEGWSTMRILDSFGF